jgi:DNA-binding NarL/FixJ family response regulator
LLVDDHSLVREGLRELLEAQGGIAVVGEAADSESAVSLVAEERPHVVLLDVEIPGDDAPTTVTRMRQVSPETQVLILSMYDGPELLRSLLAAGIRGYLHKSASIQQVAAAVRGARSDDGRVLLAVSRVSLAQIDGHTPDLLSDREREVLTLAAHALTNTQIGSRLGLTEATVKRHLRNIFVKLGAVSRIDAVNKAVSASLIKVDKRPNNR